MSATKPTGQGTQRIAIVGLGAIGGSVALALIERGSGLKPTGFSPNEGDQAGARAAGVRVGASLDEAVRHADLVLLAVPLSALPHVARSVVGVAGPNAVILHAASLQRRDAVSLSGAVAERVYGTHPFAGTQASGFAAARADMFVGASVYLESRAPAAIQEIATRFWNSVGAGAITAMEADAHDQLMACASHVPQLVGTALASVLADQGVDPTRLGSGARDTTRLAGSSFDMWESLLLATPPASLATLSAMESRLAVLRSAIERRDTEALRSIWEAARGWRARANPSTTSEGNP